MPKPASADVDAYIEAAPAKARAALRQMRGLIRGAAPQAEESVSYRMPYYSYRGRLIYFALMRDWVGLYMLGGAKAKYGKELAPYLSGVSTARFPLDQRLPAELIRRIVKLRVAENDASASSASPAVAGRSSPRTPVRGSPRRARRSRG